MVDVVLAATLGGLRDGARGLPLGADEENASAAGGYVAQGDQRLVKQGHGLLEIDDVNAITRAEQVGAHLRVPTPGLVPEMHAGFEKLAHGEFWQSHWPSFLRFLLRGSCPGWAGHRIGMLSESAVFRV